MKFMDVYFMNTLNAMHFWLQFDRGSPHVHGVARLKDAPRCQESVVI